MAQTKVQRQKKIIKSEQKAICRITNNDLVCKDCLQRLDDSILFGNTSRCEHYTICKPLEVLDGGNCDEYVKE